MVLCLNSYQVDFAMSLIKSDRSLCTNSGCEAYGGRLLCALAVGPGLIREAHCLRGSQQALGEWSPAVWAELAL